MCVSPMTNISSPDFLASLFKQYGNEASALVVANDALAFYGVILLKGGKVESIWSPYSMWPYGPKEARKAIPSHAYLCVGRKTLRQGVKEMFSL